jgi:hypothetical protein
MPLSGIGKIEPSSDLFLLLNRVDQFADDFLETGVANFTLPNC